ncbi:MAG: type II secretion system F family protein [Armatimonadota bacterium]|nr:type II secretion system F family protein [Armatimonadota bacterium]MDR7451943.1 type II secretion system F family protein [Armatimonadota bacterium]MDR7466625.1 type II secretion system F family protein [Armatimonadota bacterium]MDR7492901.1 type II secretion system F family protein [Armatimonadota bacterium]MDR7500428.1 type II secretion system F family protein [Armatimonadota bacterium]
MARFTYRAFDQAGRLETGVVDAETARLAAASLQARGYLVSALQEQEQLESASRQLARLFRVNRGDLVLFTRQLATMISAGLPIVGALQVLEQHASNRRLRGIIKAVRLGIERGGSLSAEIARHPEAFNPFFVNTVRAGEVSGVLDAALERLADYMERELDLIQKVRTAATYPLLVLGFTVLVAAGAVIFIVPMFTRVFQSFRVPLPVVTVVLLQVSRALAASWWVLLLLAAAVAAAVAAVRRSPSGRRALDALWLRLPILGPVVLRLALSRFGRSMAVVIRSGVPLMEGITAVAGALGNQVVGSAVEMARDRMRVGASMAEALAASPVIPPMVVQMVRVGEESGAMEEVLNKVADYYEREVDNTVKRFAAVVEPALIFAVGAVVFVVALAVLLPIWSLIGNIRR